MTKSRTLIDEEFQTKHNESTNIQIIYNCAVSYKVSDIHIYILLR